MLSARRPLLLVFLAASVLWLPNLGTIPKWDWDEGYNLNYARNISEGRLLWFSIKYAFVPHPPLFLLALSFLVKFFGGSIMVLRLFTVALNFALILLLYFIGLEAAGERVGLLASLLYAIYPSAVYWGRMGFANHLLSLLVVSSLYFLIRHIKHGGKWWIPCCLSAGLSALTEPQGLFVAATLSLYFLVREKPGFIPAFSLLFTPFIIFFLVMSSTSEYFIGDVAFQFQRFKLAQPLILALPVLFLAIIKRRFLTGFARSLFDPAGGFTTGFLFSLWYVPATLLAAHLLLSVTLVAPLSAGSLFAGGDYYWLGIIGLLFLGGYMNHVLILYFLPSFLAVVAFGRSDHMFIPLYPFFAMGLAVLLSLLYQHLRGVAGLIPAILIVSYPFPFAFYNSLSAHAPGGVFSPEPISDLTEVAAYVNSHSHSGFVITTSNLARYFKNSTVITQSIVYAGYPIEYYPIYPSGRYAFNASYLNAEYAVIPDGMLEWLWRYAPGPAVEIGRWPQVNSSGYYGVYRNPTSV
ncbi:MAG: glycosyltransferase family 39 protein [Candidatus Altiarchaeota archaeon]